MMREPVLLIADLWCLADYQNARKCPLLGFAHAWLTSFRGRAP